MGVFSIIGNNALKGLPLSFLHCKVSLRHYNNLNRQTLSGFHHIISKTSRTIFVRNFNIMQPIYSTPICMMEIILGKLQHSQKYKDSHSCYVQFMSVIGIVNYTLESMAYCVLHNVRNTNVIICP